MPLFHGNAIMALWAPALSVGATVCLTPSFSASGFLPDVRYFGATFFTYVGKALGYLMATPERPDDADNPLVRGFGTEASPDDQNEFRRRIEQRQFSVFVHQLCRPVRNAWTRTAVLAGVISLPGFATAPRPYLRTRWVPQGWAYLHPVQDVQAKKLEVRAGFRSRSSVILSQGDDPELTENEMMADNARADAKGLSLDSDSRLRDDQGEIIEDNRKETP